MKASTAAENGFRCPRCGGKTTRDLRERGYVRHITNPACDFEKGEKDFSFKRDSVVADEVAGRLTALSILVEIALLETFTKKLGSRVEGIDHIQTELRRLIDSTQQALPDRPALRRGAIDIYRAFSSQFNKLAMLHGNT